MNQNKELFVKIKDVGFTFILDMAAKRNLISPALLTFWRTDESDLNTERILFNAENSETPFYLGYPSSEEIESVFRYVGKELIIRHDHKLKYCRSGKLTFEYDNREYDELFFVDRSLGCTAAILCSTFFKKLKQYKR